MTVEVAGATTELLKAITKLLKLFYVLSVTIVLGALTVAVVMTYLAVQVP